MMYNLTEVVDCVVERAVRIAVVGGHSDSLYADLDLHDSAVLKLELHCIIIVDN
jgi:hypothetical protein